MAHGRYRLPLSNTPSEGRLDVLAYKALERGAKFAEANYGLVGLWDAVSGEAEKVVRAVLPKEKIKIPPAVKIILARMEQAQAARVHAQAQERNK